jgi:Fe-S oxidoreductase
MDTLMDYRYTMESCNHCGQCRFMLAPKMKGWKYAEVCPIYQRYRFESYSGQGLINIAEELLEGTLKYEDDLIAHIYTCTTCGACDINCNPSGYGVLDTILALRAKCVEDGRGPMPGHAEYARLVETSHNIYGKAHDQRFNWLPEKLSLSPNASIAYFVGCTTAYLYPAVARDTVKILRAGGVDFKILGGDEYCRAPLADRSDRSRENWPSKTSAPQAARNPDIDHRCAECYGPSGDFTRELLQWISRSCTSRK